MATLDLTFLPAEMQAELKRFGDDMPERMDKEFVRCGLGTENIVVSSFNLDWLVSFKQQCPAYRTTWCSFPDRRPYVSGHGIMAADRGAHRARRKSVLHPL